MDLSEIRKQCYGCGYRQEIPGDTHISCLFDWRRGSLDGILAPGGNRHGIIKGWYNFPFNYDPTWMAEECRASSKEADPAKKIAGDGLFAIIATLGNR